MRWFVRLFLDRYNGGGFDTRRVTAAIHAPSCREAVNDATFQAQGSCPDCDVHVIGASSPDMSPYPPGWNDTGMQ
jgi:hypothetical protein